MCNLGTRREFARLRLCYWKVRPFFPLFVLGLQQLEGVIVTKTSKKRQSMAPHHKEGDSHLLFLLSNIIRLDKTLFSKKYGVHLARFTHRSTNVVYASTKEDGKTP